MKPVSQSVLHDPDKGDVGDCFAACLASILEVEIEEVPSPTDEKEYPQWFDPYKEYLVSKGFQPLWVHLDGCVVPGYTVRSGMAVRGVEHSCVAYNGEVVWDPHPSQDGLITHTDTLMLLPTEDGDMMAKMSILFSEGGGG